MTGNKRWALVLLAASMMAGCPLFPDDPRGCVSDAQCPSAYSCDVALGVCRHVESRACGTPSDCGSREICGADGYCHAGSCAISGCVDGYVCEPLDGVWTCVTAGQGGASGAAGESGAEGDSGAGGMGGFAGVAGGGDAGMAGSAGVAGGGGDAGMGGAAGAAGGAGTAGASGAGGDTPGS